ncbi:hypothetical protein [Emcibacter sp.]|uniref:hypothetical protein n=1 Tax=Emcibacter sp. TaxID=1979954 RepID=UPI003A93BE85
MASLRKHGKKWQADVRIKGVRKTKLFRTKMEAHRWAVETEEMLKPTFMGGAEPFVKQCSDMRKRKVSRNVDPDGRLFVSKNYAVIR